MAELENALRELERAHPSTEQPIFTYVDQSRIIISWPYRERRSNAPSV
jgi:hypothetical protein